tara:strand:+ start:2025 stop:2342 length:318 start_codon:yes stop_codon:yes gene_type:complete
MENSEIRATDLNDLVNQLSNEQIVYLLSIIFNNRPTEIFVGRFPKDMQRCLDLDSDLPVNLNGNMLQINTEFSFVDEEIPWVEEENEKRAALKTNVTDIRAGEWE